jgi:hypothetical protein
MTLTWIYSLVLNWVYTLLRTNLLLLCLTRIISLLLCWSCLIRTNSRLNKLIGITLNISTSLNSSWSCWNNTLLSRLNRITLILRRLLLISWITGRLINSFIAALLNLRLCIYSTIILIHSTSISILIIRVYIRLLLLRWVIRLLLLLLLWLYLLRYIGIIVINVLWFRITLLVWNTLLLTLLLWRPLIYFTIKIRMIFFVLTIFLLLTALIISLSTALCLLWLTFFFLKKNFHYIF